MSGSLQDSAISLDIIADRTRFRTDTFENTADVFILMVPLSRGNAELRSDSGLIYDGDVRQGMLRVVSPGERVAVTRRSAARAAVVKVPGQRFRRLADQAAFKPRPGGLTFVAPILEANPHVEQLCATLELAPSLDPSQRSLFVDGVTTALLSIVLHPDDTRHAADATTGLSVAELDRCLAFAESQIGGPLDLESWAAVLDMPVAEFARRFQKATRSAPYAYFLDLRIARARDLLQLTHLSLVEIALEVGFSSQSHFSEAFRRRMGVPPGIWRGR